MSTFVPEIRKTRSCRFSIHHGQLAPPDLDLAPRTVSGVREVPPLARLDRKDTANPAKMFIAPRNTQLLVSWISAGVTVRAVMTMAKRCTGGSGESGTKRGDTGERNPEG